MNILPILTFITIFCISFRINAFEVKSVSVNCPENSDCNFLKNRISLALKSSSSKEEIEKNLKFMIYDPLISSFSFKYEIEDGMISFNSEAKLSLLVSKIRIKGTNLKLKTNLGKNGLREGKKYSKEAALFSVREIKNQLAKEGYFSSQVWFKKVLAGNKLNVDFYINSGSPTIIKTVKVNSNSPLVLNKFKSLEGKNWSLSKVNVLKQEMLQQMNELGFYNYSISEKIIFNEQGEKSAVLKLNVDPGVKQVFNIEGNKIIPRGKILDRLKQSISRLRQDTSKTQVTEIVKSFYISNGVIGTKVLTSIREGVDSESQKVISFNIRIVEGDFRSVRRFEFKNLSPESAKHLRVILNEVDKPYFDSGKYNKQEIESIQASVVEKLKKLGYLDPKVSLRPKDSSENEIIEIEMELGDRFLIGEISLGFNPDDLKVKIPITLKRGDIFSESIVDGERKNIVKKLKEQGYFFAKFDSSRPFISENNLTKRVVLDFQISPGLKSVLNEVRVDGLQKTKKKVIFREINAQKGEVITPEFIQNINDQLVSLNIFSFLSISPVVSEVTSDQNLVDLIINVREKDFGVLSISPGFRTDIGPKIDVNIQRNNISGENKNLLIGGRVSKRTDLTLLDPQRRDFSTTFLEYRLNTSYSIPYFFKSFNRSILSSEFTRRRFYGFDADIIRASGSLDKKVSQKGSLFLRYQFELIKQFNATESLENGEFRIGGITTSYFYDNRNRVINPSKGNYHSVSAELAHPLFLSMDDELEINFLKLQSRNRFYKRFNSFIFASSFAAGWQKNLGRGGSEGTQKRSYIPRVKVFRLEGIDNVRGYNSTEVNRVYGGEDISEFVIDDEASFFNLKAELRREVNSSVMLSTFYDLGKVMPKLFDFKDLNHSVGLSLKLLTPVGTLNLDYGLKLNREFVNGEKEQFGRFHLMVGYF